MVHGRVTQEAFPAEQDALPTPSFAPWGVGDFCLPNIVWWGSASAVVKNISILVDIKGVGMSETLGVKWV